MNLPPPPNNAAILYKEVSEADISKPDWYFRLIHNNDTFPAFWKGYFASIALPTNDEQPGLTTEPLRAFILARMKKIWIDPQPTPPHVKPKPVLAPNLPKPTPPAKPAEPPTPAPVPEPTSPAQ